MICLKNISKSFSNSKSERIILEDINIEFNNKGLYLIKGESGSGKTTLLNMIIRDLKPDTGNIYIDGKDLEEFNNEELNYYRSNYISVLNQNNTLLSDLNLRDNLNLVLKISDIKLDDEYIKNTLKKFKLDEDILLSYPNDISGGELKRFQLILAILKDTKVIILDEPDSSLDLENQLIIKELIKEISNDKLVIVISHNVDLYN